MIYKDRFDMLHIVEPSDKEHTACGLSTVLMKQITAEEQFPKCRKCFP
jgi:hypothetical protein